MPDSIAALIVVLVATRELVPANEFVSFQTLERMFTASPTTEQGARVYPETCGVVGSLGLLSEVDFHQY